MNAHRQPVETTDTDQPVLRGQRLSPDGAVIHSTAQISKSHFEPWTEVGEGSRILNSTFEAYSYCDRFADIANTTVGRFSNIAAMTRIGPTDHPFTHAAQHHILLPLRLPPVLRRTPGSATARSSNPTSLRRIVARARRTTHWPPLFRKPTHRPTADPRLVGLVA